MRTGLGKRRSRSPVFYDSPRPVGPLHLDLFSVFALFSGGEITRLCAPDFPAVLAHHGLVEEVDERGLASATAVSCKIGRP